MKTTQGLAVASSSLLAAGAAHGAIVWSGSISNVISGNASYPVDLNQDSTIDYTIRFDGFNGGNQLKPFIDCRASSGGSANPNAWVLAKANTGEPVTAFGTMIDASYAAAYPTNQTGYLYEQYNNNTVVGDWPSTSDTEGYVGLELSDGVTFTNYGWVHLIYQASSATKTLMVVDYAYETTPNKGIVASMTAYLPTIYREPQSQTNGAGSSAQFNVVALGDPPPSYQWMAGAAGSGVYTNLPENSHFSGTTTAALTINPVTQGDALDYIVVVTNSLGSVTSSPPAQLTVVVASLAGPFPVQAQLFQGATGHFGIDVLSGVPTGFQWRNNGTNLADGLKYSGTAGSNLVINSLASGDAGNYDVIVTTAYGAVTSSVAPLAVLATNEPFIATELADGPLAFYRLNETNDPVSGGVIAYDSVSALNGVYGPDVQNGNPGYNVLGPGPADGFPGFASANTAIQIVPNDANSAITLPPWNLNTNVVTITAWINPQGPQPGGAAVVYTRSTNLMVCGMAYYDTFGGTNFSLGYNWNDNSADYFWNSGLKPPTNQWSFVALVITPNNGTVYLMNTNGILSAVNSATNAVQAWNDKIYIGTDPRDAGGLENFNGKIDEIAVFNRALSSSELQWLYHVTAGDVWLRIDPAGSNLTVQWTRGTLLEAGQITGPWTTNNASSPYSVAPTGQQKFYRAVAP